MGNIGQIFFGDLVNCDFVAEGTAPSLQKQSGFEFDFEREDLLAFLVGQELAVGVEFHLILVAIDLHSRVGAVAVEKTRTAKMDEGFFRPIGFV